jgi:hypothetical protein
MIDIIQSLQKQKEAEEKNIQGLKPIQEKAGGPYLEAILAMIIADSTKHVAICDALIGIIGGEELLVPETLLKKQTISRFREHIELEADMLHRLEDIQSQIDSRAQSLIEYMLEEKRRHHVILSGLMELFEVGEKSMDKYFEIADNLVDSAHLTGRRERARNPGRPF